MIYPSCSKTSSITSIHRNQESFNPIDFEVRADPLRSALTLFGFPKNYPLLYRQVRFGKFVELLQYDIRCISGITIFIFVFAIAQFSL